jgi:hypothetical protein
MFQLHANMEDMVTLTISGMAWVTFQEANVDTAIQVLGEKEPIARIVTFLEIQQSAANVGAHVTPARCIGDIYEAKGRLGARGT